MADNVWPGVIELINSKPALTAELGTNVYPITLDQRTSYPAATYRTVSQIGNRTFDGASRYDFNMLEFHVYATLKDDVDRIVALLRKELEGTFGTFAGVVINGISFMDSGSDDYLETLEKHTKSIEFKVDTRRNP